MERFAEQGGIANVRYAAHFGEKLSRIAYTQFVTSRSPWRDGWQLFQLARLATDKQPRHMDVADIGAPLRLVHIVCGDQQSDAATSQLEQQIPQLAASDGVDASRRFVQKK